MVEILRSLRRENANLAKVLDAFDRQVTALKNTGIADYEVLEAIVDYCLYRREKLHNLKENLIIGKLRERDGETAEEIGALNQMQADFGQYAKRFSDAFDRLLEDVELSRDTFTNAGRNFAEFCRRHMEMEEKVLYPTAAERLTSEDWRDIEARTNEAESAMATVQKRFERLFADILTLDRARAEA
ncbi:MAG: hemerythrin domain-containing protein [Minwuiales bacterium]|nr:hemerythrin domain-containing protein [Minwuiales bacterium]